MGTSLTRNRPHPKDHHRVLGIDLLQGLRRRRFLLGEVQGLLEIKDTHRPRVLP